MTSGASHSNTGSLDQASVRHVAKLARLRLSESDVERFSGQLSSILGHISKLNEVDVEGVEPMAHPLPLNNRLAEDNPSPPMPLEHLFRNAPGVEGRYLAVPKVLADGGGA
jgi:aspartyl-tRNA(Asn)/glutamyl-tRNA(Gln) amidotransferase subunit C